MQANKEPDSAVSKISRLKRANIYQQNNSFDFFIQGFDLPPQQQILRDKLLHICPTLKTKSYRDSLFEIISSLTGMDHFSDNLQKKVDGLLQGQQNQFVQSYKQHLKHIKKQFQKMDHQIKQLQQKVRYYQNQGKMSALVKKVFQLEQQSAKLYKIISQKDARVRQVQLQLKVNTMQMNKFQSNFKNKIRQNTEPKWKESSGKIQMNTSTSPKHKINDFSLFPTQPIKRRENVQHHSMSIIQAPQSTNSKILPQPSIQVSQRMYQQGSSNLQKRKNSMNPPRKGSLLSESKLKQQISRLKYRNQKLMSFQSKVMDNQSQIQQFFVNSVQELKRQIKLKKKIAYCSLQEFKKQDKLTLLIKVLSNDDILTYLHERLFRKNQAYLNKTVLNQLKEDASGAKKLPSLKFQMVYQPE